MSGWVRGGRKDQQTQYEQKYIIRCRWTEKSMEWKIFDNQLLRCGQCNFSFSAWEVSLKIAQIKNREEVLVSNSVEDYHLLHGKR